MIDIPNNPTNGSTITLGTTKYTYQDGKLTPFMIKQVGTELTSPKLNVEILTEFRHPVSGKPIYTKTINFGSLPNNTTKSVAHGVVNAEGVWIDDLKSYVFASGNVFHVQYLHTTYIAAQWSTDSDITNVSMITGMNRTAYAAIVTILYTKTTDTANSPVASLYTGSLNELNLNQETHAGYRRNGKDVYQIEVDCGALPSTTVKLVTIPNYNASYKYWLSSGSYALRSSDNTIMPLPRVYSNTVDDYNINIYLQGNSIVIATYVNMSAYTETKVVLHYTK